MVDRLWYQDDKITVAGFLIPEENIFCEHGYFREPGLIENMAQSAALRVGYQASQMSSDGEKIKPPVGYIGAIKKLNIIRLPKTGDQIKTEIRIEQIVFDVTLISARTFLGSEKIAEAEMKIFLKKD